MKKIILIICIFPFLSIGQNFDLQREHFERGLEYSYSSDHQLAIDYYAKSILQARINADLLINQDGYEKDMAYYDVFFGFALGTEALYFRAKEYIALNKYKEAMKDLDEIIDLGEDVASLDIDIGMCDVYFLRSTIQNKKRRICKDLKKACFGNQMDGMQMWDVLVKDNGRLQDTYCNEYYTKCK